MKANFLVTASLLLSSLVAPAISHAGDVPPTLDGRPAAVKSVRLVPHPEENMSSVMATVEYNGICTTPTAFVVVSAPGFQYTVLESHPRGFACMAISIRKTEIEVGKIGGPVPPGITVNGLQL